MNINNDDELRVNALILNFFINFTVIKGLNLND